MVLYGTNTWQCGKEVRTYPKPLSNSNAVIKLCGTYHADKDQMLSAQRRSMRPFWCVVGSRYLILLCASIL